MAAVIKLKRGTSTPSTSDIASGEVAIDTSAQKLYVNDSGTIKSIDTRISRDSRSITVRAEIDNNELRDNEEIIRKFRGKKIGFVFQDPQTSLNPLFKIKEQLIETIQTHLNLGYQDALKKSIQLLKEVGIDNAEKRIEDLVNLLYTLGIDISTSPTESKNLLTTSNTPLKCFFLNLPHSFLEKLCMNYLLHQYILEIWIMMELMMQIVVVALSMKQAAQMKRM